MWIVSFFFSSRRRHTRWNCDWSSDVCSSDLMSLGMASEKLRDGGQPLDADRARELVASAHQTATEAIAELRDISRGIHPPVLDGGLADALATLAARSAVPVELSVEVPTRPTAAIETIAYFCAAELLANVIKHSGARRARLEAAQR